jgi:hypothetical protein
MDGAVPSTTKSKIQQAFRQLMMIGRRIWTVVVGFVICFVFLHVMSAIDFLLLMVFTVWL